MFKQKIGWKKIIGFKLGIFFLPVVTAKVADFWGGKFLLPPEFQKLVGKKIYIVGGWTNPLEKYARQIGSFPQVLVKKKQKISETTT